MLLQVNKLHDVEKCLVAAVHQLRSCQVPASLGVVTRWFVAVVAVWVVIAVQRSPGYALGAQMKPTMPTVLCPNPESQNLVMPPEIVSTGGILKGMINLTEEFQRMPRSKDGKVTCAPQLVRIFQGEGLPPAPPAQKPDPNLRDPLPGPTLRARVGDLVQLTFVNQVNSNRFDKNIDLDKCMQVGKDGNTYPADIDTYPNCLHASSTANIHFHGTHTNPNSTGDNVYLFIRPLPRNKQGNLTTTPAQVTVGLEQFFTDCTEQLKNPLNQWPVHWSDLPRSWTDKQEELLQTYQKENPDQPLWSKDENALHPPPGAPRGWPQYYIGAVPYCFALPAYTAPVFPSPPDSTSPIMGQAPGTHWYHAHKHGSTAINVANGMTGAFIIEGQYDDDLNAFYGKYMLKDSKPWNTRVQPILVLNQLGTQPNRLTGSGGDSNVDFVVNGRIRPKIQMQPGEVQLWRILNTSGRSAAYFMVPKGLEWRQLAQDGIQLANQNYRDSQNKPFYMAPGNRVDLLVKAPLKEMSADINIQNVMSRSGVKLAKDDSGTSLMSVTVGGPQVVRDGQPSEMPFMNAAPTQPKFLADITDEELRMNNSNAKTLDFSSKGPNEPKQHTINGVQFTNGQANVAVRLNTVEEWTIKNSTTDPGPIDHPFHIHINPFQVTEVFDPNERLTDPKTGVLIEKFILPDETKTDDRQCVLNPDNPDTWKPCRPVKESDLVWWDVFAIPSGRKAPRTDGTQVTIPGYFKMRSRFVDYPGLYVLHCHILIHEDRGMMFMVEVTKPMSTLVEHH